MAQYERRQHHLRMQFFLAGTFLTALMSAFAPAQTRAIEATATPPWQIAAGGKMSFEVASVRQAGPNAPYSGNVDLDASDYILRYNGGLVTMSGPLIAYILFAYKVEDESQYARIHAELPRWAQDEQFIVEARPAGHPTKDQIRLMMQSLLADRFNLAVHTEVRQLPVYSLVLEHPGKPGPGLQPHPEDGLCTKVPDLVPPVSKGQTLPAYCGLIFLHQPNGQLNMRTMDYSIESIAGQIATAGANLGGLDRLPVLNRTGLTGKFDLNVEFLRTPLAAQPSAAETETVAPAPSFTEALERQAGLKLIKETGPVTIFVIDRVDQPSDN